MNKKSQYYRKSLKSLMQVRRIKTPEEVLVFSANAGKKRLPKDFSLLVWNIFKSQGGPSFFEDLSALSEGVDIVCLQEVLRRNKPKIGSIEHSFNYVFASSYTRSDGHCDGVLSACRFSIDKTALRIPSVSKEPIAKTPKVALLTYIPMATGHMLAIVNLHSILFRSLRQSERELIHVMKQLANFDGPALVVGDLNTFTSKYLRRAVNIMQGYGFSLVEPINDPRTSLKQLDHIFCRGLTPLSIEILASVISSDHKPIRARFRL